MKKMIALISLTLLFACDTQEVIYDFQTQLESDIKAIDAYIVDQGITNVSIHPSGMRYILLEEGDGEWPVDGNRFQYHMILERLDGRRFRSWSDQSPVDQVEFLWTDILNSRVQSHLFQGLHEATDLVKLDGRVILFVPSGLAGRFQEFDFFGTVNGENRGFTLEKNTNLIIEATLCGLN